MGVRRRIYTLINEKLPSWANAVTRYEGFVTVLDQELKGTARFAKKLGWPLPVWVTDTTTLMTASSRVSSSYIDVEANPWIQPSARIRLDNRYDVTVTDVTNNGTRLHLAYTLPTVFPVDTTVTIHSYPLEVVGNYTSPVQTFLVKSPYPIYVGDILLLPPSDQEIEVTTVRTDSVVDGDLVFEVTLDRPVYVSLLNESTVSLKAYPAYESTTLLLPMVQPTVIDRISGVFYTDMTDVREVDTVTIKDAAIQDIATYSTDSKNLPVYRTNLPVDMFLFGRRMEGIIKWNSSQESVVFMPDQHLRSQLRYTFAPPWKTGQASGWQFLWEATAEAKVAVFMGNTRTMVTMPAGQFLMNVPMPNHDVDVITFTVEFTDPESRVSLVECTLTDTPVRMVSHTTVAHVQGLWVWGSTGLLGKRALRLSDVTAYADMSGTLTSGFFA